MNANEKFGSQLSRRTLLRRTTAIGAGAAAVWMLAPAGLAAPLGRGSARATPPAATPPAGDVPAECLGEEELAALPDLEPLPPNGVEALLGLFDEYPLVALGEDHGIWEIHDFVWSALRHPRFPDKVDALVVEFGNARYQDVIDRYVAGEGVPRSELVRVWRDTTQGGSRVWDSPIYEQTFAVAREVNRGLPPERRIRVLLGDPPIDWAGVERQEDAGRYLEQRDAHYAEVVEREVLAKGHRALLIAGLLHFVRLPPPPPDNTGPYNPGVVARLDERAPGRTFVLAFATGAPVALDPERTQERRLATELPVPSVARVAGTWLGASGCLMVAGGQPLRVEDQVDGVYYVGPGDTWTMAEPSPFLYAAEPAHFAELRRRHELLSGRPLPLDEPQYFVHGEPDIYQRGGATYPGGMVVTVGPGTPPAGADASGTPSP